MNNFWCSNVFHFLFHFSWHILLQEDIRHSTDIRSFGSPPKMQKCKNSNLSKNEAEEDYFSFIESKVEPLKKLTTGTQSNIDTSNPRRYKYWYNEIANNPTADPNNEEIFNIRRPSLSAKYVVNKAPIKLATGIIIDEKFRSMLVCVLSKMIVE